MRVSLSLLALLGCCHLVHADPQPAPAPDSKPPGAEKQEDQSPKEDAANAKAKEKDKDSKEVVSTHAVQIGASNVDYTVTAGTLPLKDAEGKVTAEVFYIAYTKQNVPDLTKRPVTFSFNGGPGSSSVWMHLGLLGPRRVKLKEDGNALPPPYELVDNEFSLLDETDLVFIDPVGTGYSKASKPEEAKKFYGVKEDAQSVAEFIRLYVTRNTRWASPKFLIGESYGTTRAAALSGVLAGRHRMNLNGIMLVSTVLNFQTIWGAEGNDLPHVLYLPSYTATAWHHKKLAPDLQSKPLPDVLKIAEAFALGDYNHTLMHGSSIAPEKRAATLKEMARLTGLKEEFLDRANLRPSLSRFSVELLREKDLQTGRFDSRYTGAVRDRLTETAEGDPSADAIFSAFGSTINHYIRTELKYEEDRPYEILASVGPWNWDANNEFVNVAETLARAMVQNPFLKVHVSSGYTDMATPYFATHYTFKHLALPAELQANITLDDYAAGHMMYLNLPDLKKQKEDLAKFIRSATGQAAQ